MNVRFTMCTMPARTTLVANQTDVKTFDHINLDKLHGKVYDSIRMAEVEIVALKRHDMSKQYRLVIEKVQRGYLEAFVFVCI